eukprot:CAMPEP_0202726620 /NCGR_PEP_ID=MMETSP1385-20130828/184705_1 /ASSEMBLY_ACC=CAM_ASM_000861 /TAXON_ID=933848 /ORGANISM="Elphidium margaritaceum" /LENGTH=519 /DNA_ID=CAMNT_0049392843 /DNA_START=84 /DNA_END=1643 /DNA_ORIENTATION=-
MGTILSSDCCFGSNDSRSRNNDSSSSNESDDLDEHKPLKDKGQKKKKRKKKKKQKMYNQDKYVDRDESFIEDSDEEYSHQQPRDESVMAPLYQMDTKAMEMILDLPPGVPPAVDGNGDAQMPEQNAEMYQYDQNADAILPEIPAKPDSGSIAGGNVSLASNTTPVPAVVAVNDIVISADNVHESFIEDSDEEYSHQQPRDESVMAPLYQMDTKAMEMILDLPPGVPPAVDGNGDAQMPENAEMNRSVQLRAYLSQDMYQYDQNADAILPEIPAKPDSGSIAGGNVSLASNTTPVPAADNVNNIQSMDTAPNVRTAVTEAASKQRLSVFQRENSKSEDELRALVDTMYAVTSEILDDGGNVANDEHVDEEAAVESDHSSVSENEQKEIDRRKSVQMTNKPMAIRKRTPVKLYRDCTATPWEQEEVDDAMNAMTQQLLHLQNANSSTTLAVSQPPNLNSMAYGVDLSSSVPYTVALSDGTPRSRALVRDQSVTEWDEQETNVLKDEMTEQLVHLMKAAPPQ